MGLTGSHFVAVPANVAPETRRYYQQLTRFSAAFAFLADVSMLVMGGDLKRKEKLSARLGDILSLMYLCSATLKRYEAEGRQAGRCAADALGDLGRHVQGAERLRGRDSNFPNRFIARLLHWYIFPLGRPYEVPSDKLGHEVAQAADRAVGHARPPHRRPAMLPVRLRRATWRYKPGVRC
jgi:acyl-CoA dehydrogenase